MGLFLVLWRIPALLVWTLACELVRRGMGVARGGGRARGARVVRLWGCGFLLLAGVRVRRSGRPSEGPQLLVANHLSVLDVPLLAAQLGPRFVAKAEIARWPIIGSLARGVGCLFVDRGRGRAAREVGRELEAALSAGETVVLFAEGGVTPGDRVYPLFGGLLEPALRAQVPVRWAAITYRTQPPDRPPAESVLWWGRAGVWEHLLSLLQVRRIEARVTFGEEAVCAPNRRELARLLHARMQDAYEPVPGTVGVDSLFPEFESAGRGASGA